MNRKKLIAVILFLMILILGGVGLLISNRDTEEEPIEVVEQPKEETEEGPDYSEEIALWDSNKEISDDYIGQLYFDSGLINLPVVQAEDNETYFRHDWQTGNYDEEGSVFMDYRNTVLLDQNIIIYGHNVEASYEPSLTHKFTPLHKLEDKENYEANKTIYFLLEDRILEYEVAAVYYCGIEEIDGDQYVKEGEPTYYYTDFNEEEFETFITKVKENSYYDTGVEVGYEDEFLTLQTCTSGTIDKFLILAKLAGSVYIR